MRTGVNTWPHGPTSASKPTLQIVGLLFGDCILLWVLVGSVDSKDNLLAVLYVGVGDTGMYSPNCAVEIYIGGIFKIFHRGTFHFHIVSVI